MDAPPERTRVLRAWWVRGRHVESKAKYAPQFDQLFRGKATLLHAEAGTPRKLTDVKLVRLGEAVPVFTDNDTIISKVCERALRYEESARAGGGEVCMQGPRM